MIGVKIGGSGLGLTGLALDLILESGDDFLASGNPGKGRHCQSRYQRQRVLSRIGLWIMNRSRETQAR